MLINTHKLIAVVIGLSMSLVAYANNLQQGTAKTTVVHEQDKASQTRINATDAAIKDTAEEYLSNERIADVTDAYNDQVARLIDAQEKDIIDLQQQIDSLEDTDRAVLPMLNEMLGSLESFVDKDAPFLEKERRQRLSRLANLLDRADVSVAEKYRQLLEAFMVEVQYGRTFEAYRGAVNVDGEQQVNFLRLGRVALYYQSLDGLESYLWQPKQGRWERLSDKQNLVIAQGLLMAQQQKVPTLLNLPLPHWER